MGTDGFERGPHLIEGRAVIPGLKDCFKHMATMIDTDEYMPFLLEYAISKGCVLEIDLITGDLVINESKLLKKYSADIIINCTGLKSFTLTKDETIYPLRGSLINLVD